MHQRLSPNPLPKSFRLAFDIWNGAPSTLAPLSTRPTCIAAKQQPRHTLAGYRGARIYRAHIHDATLTTFVEIVTASRYDPGKTCHNWYELQNSNPVPQASALQDSPTTRPAGRPEPAGALLF